MRALSDLQFDNTYARLPADFHQRVDPTPVPDPYLVAFNSNAANLIDLDAHEGSTAAFVQHFSGNLRLPGSDPVAMKYSGHQFGSYVPQLGDGRAILLGEAVGSNGRRWDLHLKGGGKTMFSRFGDGRAVLRSSIREYLCCEAMYALGIPTTRALCVIGTPLEVYREGVETGALVVRMAPCHVRFGSFEIFAHRGQVDQVRLLADYVIEHHYREFRDSDRKYLTFFEQVVDRTARLVAQWQAVGFSHGVLNTDNMSILGLTLDYGPYGFMEQFDPSFICNHSDETGRYAFDQQPRIGYWNLAQLGRSLLSLISIDDAQAALARYVDSFNDAIHLQMTSKLGLQSTRQEDEQLWRDALDILADGRVDYTNWFRMLCDVSPFSDEPRTAVRSMFDDPARFDGWLVRYLERLRSEGTDDADRQKRMRAVNPKFVLRNYLAQIAIEKSQGGDYSEVDRLRGVLDMPFDEQPEMDHYSRPGPEWTRHLVVSCSS